MTTPTHTHMYSRNVFLLWRYRRVFGGSGLLALSLSLGGNVFVAAHIRRETLQLRDCLYRFVPTHSHLHSTYIHSGKPRKNFTQF